MRQIRSIKKAFLRFPHSHSSHSLPFSGTISVSVLFWSFRGPAGCCLCSWTAYGGGRGVSVLFPSTAEVPSGTRGGAWPFSKPVTPVQEGGSTTGFLMGGELMSLLHLGYIQWLGLLEHAAQSWSLMRSEGVAPDNQKSIFVLWPHDFSGPPLEFRLLLL